MPTASGSPSHQPPDGHIAVGVVSGAHGSEGRVRVQSATDNPARFRKGARLIAGGQELHVQHAQQMPGGSLLLRFAEIATRSGAAALHGETLAVPESEAQEAPPGVYYHYQLVGMSVEDEAGARLGELTEIIATGANDVYVVTAEQAELLLPAVDGVIVHVDTAAGRMTAAVPNGLAWRALRPPGEKSKSRKRPRAKRKPPTGTTPPS